MKLLKDVIKPREKTGASVVVTNNSGQTGSFTVELRIDGMVVDHKDVMLRAQSSETVTFKFSREEKGTCSVEIGHFLATLKVETGVLTPEFPDSNPVVESPLLYEDWTIPEDTGQTIFLKRCSLCFQPLKMSIAVG